MGHAWKGYGSAIFLELGRLSQPKSRNHPTGDHCIAIEWDWRVELGPRVLFGSSNTGAEIAERITELEGSQIQSIQIHGSVRELLVSFSLGYCLRTAVMVTGDPQWSIRLAEKEWLYVKDGELEIGDGRAECTLEETRAFDHASLTATRWGTPNIAPAAGSCFQCSSFVRLDGQANLLDYGVCSAAHSGLDGRAVNRESGCPHFTLKETE